MSISEVRHWWLTHQNAGHAHEIWWERRATAGARHYGLVAPRAAGSVSAAAYYGAFLCVISLFFLGQGHVPARLVIFSCGVAMVWLALRLPSLTSRGVALRERYQAFRNYLHDYGRFHDKEAEQIVLWDYYLAYAVTLGLATESLWELFIVPPPVGEGTTVRTLEAWLRLRPLPPVWSDEVPDAVLRTQRRVAEALASAPAQPATQAASMPPATAPTMVPASTARGRSRRLPTAPRPPRGAPPPSTYEANLAATQDAVKNVFGWFRVLLLLPFIFPIWWSSRSSLKPSRPASPLSASPPSSSGFSPSRLSCSSLLPSPSSARGDGSPTHPEISAEVPAARRSRLPSLSRAFCGW